ncbi:MAG: hypothetical protein AAGJ73_04445 [Pseudomonadota bacterium]
MLGAYTSLIMTMNVASAATVEATPVPDPFAEEIPLTTEELSEQRGGYFVSGLLIDFGVTLTDITVQTGLSATAPGLDGGPAATVIFDPETTKTIINNTIDGAVISRNVQLNIAIPNFTSAIDLAGTRNAMSSMRVETQVLELLSF